jgi:predicted nucleic acid-binding protein
MTKYILTDSGFWIGYFEERDAHHQEALGIASVIFKHRVICPFPVTYEFLNTRFSRNHKRLVEYELLLKKVKIAYIHDEPYRAGLIDDFLGKNKQNQRISLVDLVINRIIEDVNVKIDCMVTFNQRDFYAGCWKRSIAMLPE